MCGFPDCEHPPEEDAVMCRLHRKVRVSKAWPSHEHVEAHDN